VGLFIFDKGYLVRWLLLGLVRHQPVINLRHFFWRQTIIYVLVLAADLALRLALSHDLEARSRNAAKPLPPTG
jgi:hypothetical protein